MRRQAHGVVCAIEIGTRRTTLSNQSCPHVIASSSKNIRKQPTATSKCVETARALIDAGYNQAFSVRLSRALSFYSSFETHLLGLFHGQKQGDAGLSAAQFG
jgi:hypothetical protein